MCTTCGNCCAEGHRSGFFLQDHAWGNERPVAPGVATGRTGVNLVEVIHSSSDLFPTVDNRVDKHTGPGGRARRRAYFHWVETTNPPAMKPKPMTMFQLPSASTGRLPWVT